jgi:DNA-binding NtrC family response regulator
VIQERQLMRLGSDRVIGVNIRIIAATNKDLLDLCERGLFRPDLYHRLNVLSLPIPPLSQRRDDILPLFSHFMGREVTTLPPEVRARLLAYHWPGNVRELANCAHHYRLMGELKEEIARPNAAPQQARGPMAELPPSLLQRADPELLAAVLNVMGRERPGGVGRGYLGRSLARQGFQVGEGRLKGILAALAGEGLIISGKGRGGSRLSESGRRLLGRLGPAV